MTYAKARKIRVAERDRSLDLSDWVWPTAVPPGWEQREGHLRRVIKADVSPPPQIIPVELEELILRFPSAPLHGFQRLHEHHVQLDGPEHFHSFRVLRTSDPTQTLVPVKRIFLMHTGLNERDTMGLYYRLASQLVQADPATVCIVRPFPGHMTRYPFQAFGETPLDRYLADGSHLFRQFLRFMLETQWLLSTIARRSSYRAPSGANLLAEAEEPALSRLNPDVLADEMFEAWMSLHRASATTFAAEGAEHQSSRTEVGSAKVERGMFVDAITTLRGVLHLDRDYEPASGRLDLTTNGTPARPTDPALHVLGYSLGGFAAQSVFMSWPFLVASCSTLLAGGALRELAPTAFADPEEWQTVLHSLRYELDDRMMSDHLGIEASHVAGIDRSLFTYFKRTFYEVFQQEYRGSFQTRLEAFHQRMLFIVGGNDPVVRPQTVLESAPKSGVNLLEIGNLTHFLEGRASSREEEASRTFWLPEISSLIGRFAANAAEDQQAELAATWFDARMERPVLSREQFSDRYRDHAGIGLRRLLPAEEIAINREGALPGALFERCLEDLLDRVDSEEEQEEGVLFILRNEVPPVLLHPSVVREKAAALYHDDLSIARYCHGVAARREYIERHIDRICFVLPWNARSVMTYMDFDRANPSQSESAGGQVAPELVADDVWDYTLQQFRRITGTRKPDGTASIRVFNGNHELPRDKVNADLLALAEQFAGNERLERVASMPDCWMWVSRQSLVGAGRLSVERAVTSIAGWAAEVGKDTDSMLELITARDIRLVNISRARYNPRFRGRLVVDAAAARKLVLHAALCVWRSAAFIETDGAFA